MKTLKILVITLALGLFSSSTSEVTAQGRGYMYRDYNYGYRYNDYQQIKRYADRVTRMMTTDLRLSRNQATRVYNISLKAARYMYDRNGFTNSERKIINREIRRVLTRYQESMYVRFRSRYGL